MTLQLHFALKKLSKLLLFQARFELESPQLISKMKPLLKSQSSMPDSALDIKAG